MIADILIVLGIAYFAVRYGLFWLDIASDMIKDAFYREPKHSHVDTSHHDGCPKCELDLHRIGIQMEQFRSIGL